MQAVIAMCDQEMTGSDNLAFRLLPDRGAPELAIPQFDPQAPRRVRLADDAMFGHPGAVEWRQIGRRFWEARFKNGAFLRFRFRQRLNDEERQGIILRQLPIGLTEIFIPDSPDKSLEYRLAPELPWLELGKQLNAPDTRPAE